MPIYAGVSGSNRKLTKVPVGVSGANRNCKAAWAGVSGVNRQVFSSGQPISNLTVGKIVKCTVSGTLRSFIIVHKGKPSTEYASDCDGVWLMSQNSHSLQKWNGAKEEIGVEKTSLYSYLNTTYYNALQVSVRSQILNSTHFQRDYNTWGYNDKLTYQARVFLCTADEAGGSSNNGSLGSKLDYFERTFRESDLRKCTDYNGTTVTGWWTSSAQYNSTTGHEVQTFRGSNGYQDEYSYTSTAIGVRPFFILPHTALIGEKAESDGSYILQ